MRLSRLPSNTMTRKIPEPVSWTLAILCRLNNKTDHSSSRLLNPAGKMPALSKTQLIQLLRQALIKPAWRVFHECSMSYAIAINTIKPASQMLNDCSTNWLSEPPSWRKQYIIHIWRMAPVTGLSGGVLPKQFYQTTTDSHSRISVISPAHRITARSPTSINWHPFVQTNCKQCVP